MNMRIFTIALILALILLLPACTSDVVNDSGAVTISPSLDEPKDSSGDNTAPQHVAGLTDSPINVVYDSDDLDPDWDSAQSSIITLEGDTVTLSGNGVIADGNKVTIVSGGTYVISGTLDDGQIMVNTEDVTAVKLVLDGANINCATNAPIYVVGAEKVVLTLATGTENVITDGDVYVFGNPEADEPNAAIFSKSDLTINGDGSLEVNANYNNGIQSKDELKIVSGNISVNAVNDGIKGRDYVAIKDGNITANAGGDGMQSNNDENADKGFVVIEGGDIDITAGEDGIQAETTLVVNGGNIVIASGGGSTNSSSDIGIGDNTWVDWGDMRPGDIPNNEGSLGSAKGLKAGVSVVIAEAVITIDSSDDAIHSNDSLTINSGNIVLASGDDGIHADSTLEINGGNISLTQSYEGIESAVITINGGDIRLVARDDGINVSGGNDGSAIGGRPGQNNFNESGNSYLYVNGGYIAVVAGGDGCDVNGSINMTGGVLIINGPTSNNNGALDYYGVFNVSGGFLVAAGSAGMAQSPSMSSTQYSVMLNFSSVQPAGTIIHLEAEDGDDILTFAPLKDYQSVVLCSSELNNGETYVVYSGGNATGTVTDGLYTDGTYTAGTQYTDFTISEMVTVIGEAGGAFHGDRGGNIPPPNRH